jgi:hypothetical protein
MLRHNYIRDIPRRSRYQKNTQPSQNQILSRQLIATLKKIYKGLALLQELTPVHDIEASEIVQLKYIIDYVERIMINNTSIELVRPPLYFPSTRLTLIRQ